MGGISVSIDDIKNGYAEIDINIFTMVKISKEFWLIEFLDKIENEEIYGTSA